MKAAGYSSEELDLNDQTESVDYGVVFGIGSSSRTGQRGALQFEVRYELGLLDINSFDQTSYGGYGIPLGFQGHRQNEQFWDINGLQLQIGGQTSDRRVSVG